LTQRHRESRRELPGPPPSPGPAVLDLLMLAILAVLAVASFLYIQGLDRL
jgi:hypothetical protein